MNFWIILLFMLTSSINFGVLGCSSHDAPISELGLKSTGAHTSPKFNMNEHACLYGGYVHIELYPRLIV